MELHACEPHALQPHTTDRQGGNTAAVCAQEDASKRELLADRLKGIKACKGAMADRSNAARDGRVARNRNIQRAHERLARNQSKARGDDRAQRMEALKVCISLAQPSAARFESMQGWFEHILQGRSCRTAETLSSACLTVHDLQRL